VQTVTEKFPDITNFDTEFTFIDKAAMVSLENVQFDMNELEKGMKNARKEYDIRLESKTIDNQVLKEFLSKADQQFSELLNKYKLCQEHFSQCVEYFGESPRSQSPNQFFTTFVKFLKAFNQAKLENEQRFKQEHEVNQQQANNSNSNNENSSPQTNSSSRIKPAYMNNVNSNAEMIKELKKRNPANGHSQLRTRHQPKKEINIEDLIEEINRGYITADAERRKRQRTQEIKKDFVKTSPIQII
jgi:hypothetical protein